MDMFFIRRGSRSLHRAQRRSLYSHTRDRMHDFGCPSGSARARPLSSLSNHRPRDRHHRARTVALVPYHTRCSRRFRRSRLATPLDARTCAHVMHHTHTHTCSSTPLSSATGRCKRSSSRPRPDVRPRSTPTKPASRPPAQGERAHACAVITIAILAVVAQ